MVVSGVISEEAWTLWTSALRGNLELENHLPLLIGARQDECFLAIRSCHIILAPILIHLAFRFVCDDEITGVTAHGIVDVNREVGHLTGQIKVL